MKQPDKALLAGGEWTASLYSDGWKKAASACRVTDAASLEVLGEVGRAEPQDVRVASAVAAAAQKTWAARPFAERARVLRKAADVFQAHADEIVQWLVRESGSTPAKARSEVASCCTNAIEAAALCSHPPGLVLPDSGIAHYGMSLAQRVPRGTVGIIPPFNFPLALAFRSVAPALALGNAVVLKPDLQTAVCGGIVIARVMEEAGLPPGLLHVLPGDADAGQAICDDPGIAMVVFIGSTAVGRKVAQTCAQHLKKVTLELGGKNSAIVLDDADIDLAVSNVAFGSWFHQGQICMATGRVLVAREIAGRFTQALIAKARQLRTGNPFTQDVDLGPLINDRQVEGVKRLVDESVALGARLAVGGAPSGRFFPPTVLEGVAPGMPVFEHEVFGPVACVTVFDDDDAAVELAARTQYGLSASIFSGSVERAMALAPRLGVGMIHINAPTVCSDATVPFGGFGASGNGTRQGGPANLDEFTQWQWVTIKDRPRPLM